VGGGLGIQRIGLSGITGVKVSSTPFVFLTDTFTGKFLCGRDVGRGHPFCNDVVQNNPRNPTRYPVR
jgi:hypothetical protein